MKSDCQKWREWAEAQAHADRLKSSLPEPDTTSVEWLDTCAWVATRLRNIWWNGIKYSTGTIPKENYNA